MDCEGHGGIFLPRRHPHQVKEEATVVLKGSDPAKMKEEEDPREEVSAAEGVNVSVQVQVSSQASVGNGTGAGDSEGQAGSTAKRSFGKAQSQLKAGGTISDLGEASVTPAGPGVMTRSAAARRLTEVSRSPKESAEEGEAHPCLFIENVLDEIFKHIVNQPGPGTLIATKDVRNMRLVCKSWSTSITRLYRQTRPRQTPRQDNFEEHGPVTVKLLELLLIAGKSLQEVQLESRDYLNQQRLITQQLSLAIAKNIPRTVKKLQLNLWMNEAAFNTLAEMEAKLERVDIDVPSDLEDRTLHKFLQSQATTLKYLRLTAFVDNIKRNVEFPRLEELDHLRLPDGTVNIIIPSHFAETFPKLHCLKMSTENTISTLLSTVKKPSESLKILDLIKWNFTCPAHLFKNVGQAFPCLAELHMCLDPQSKDTVVEVFKYLDSLESLHISFFRFHQNPTLMDSLFSGIPESECNRIKNLRDFGTVNFDELQRQPSIVNLKKLKNLVIDEYYWGNELAFTDVAAHFGFLEMENLREIKMPTTAAQFSLRYMELLRDKLVLR